jgi:hypothetical protein
VAEWQRVLNTTLRNYIREREVNTMRNRKLTALLKEKGRVTFNHSGEQMEWRVQYRRVDIGDGYADMDTLTFSRQDRWKLANLEWRGYAMTDAVSKKERLMNKSKEAIINLYGETAKLLMDDMDDQFCEELYADGNVSGSKRIHGIESFFGEGSASSNNLTIDPNDTFAGLATALGNYGGTWSGTWPDGAGDAQYDFWSPLIVDYEGSGWTASTKTWPNTCLEALRYAIIKSQRSKAKKGVLDLMLMTDTLYRQFLDKLATAERIIVERGKEQNPLIALGYNDVVNYDGAMHTWEYGVPAGLVYGFNTDMMELRSLQGQLFVPTGPVYDESSMTYRFSIDFFGNCTWNPKYFCKLKNTP